MDAHPETNLKAEAVEWLVRLQEWDEDPEDLHPDPDTRWKAFCAWFVESPQHLAAFIEAVEFSQKLQGLVTRRSLDVERLFADVSNIVQFTARRPAGRRLPGALNAAAPADNGMASLVVRSSRFPAAVCASMLCLLTIPFLVSPTRASPVTYASGIGQRVFLPLEDGSTVELNTRSRIEVEMTPQRREVRLLSGEVVFDVRHDASRPFRVTSGDVVIQDVGTKFVVYRHGDGTTSVAVLEGRVDLATSARNAGSVQAGQAATISDHGGHATFHLETVTSEDLARRLSWQVGLLTFQGETLAQAVHEFNRYNQRQLIIIDQLTAARQLGGVFETVDLDSFVADLEFAFGLHAVPAPHNKNLIELRRKPEVQ